MKLIRDNDELNKSREKAQQASKEEHRTMMNLNILLAGAIAFAMLMGVMCRRADGATPGTQPRPRIDIIGDIEMEHGFLTPMELKRVDGPVDVYIDSNGGYMVSGEAIMQAIEERRAKGLHTRCYTTKAISAAFFILSSCDERIVAPYGKYMSHFPYLIVPRVTISNIKDITERLEARRKQMDKWALDVFKWQAPLMISYMVEERTMNGRELCNTFVGFCKVSYIFPLLEVE